MESASMRQEEHAAARLLLPWYVNGTLDAADRALVEAHLPGCATCREELAVERRLAALPSAPAPNPDAGWARLAARLDREAPPSPPPRRNTRPWARSHHGGGRPERLRWVVAAQFVVIVGLGGWALSNFSQRPAAPEAAYHALGASGGERAGNVLAMFRPGTTEAELRRLLTDSNARLVDGPTSAGAYVLAVPGGAGGAALAGLRRQAAVTMAEPIGPAQ